LRAARRFLEGSRRGPATCLVEAFEVLCVARLVDLLGDQERLFALALVGTSRGPENLAVGHAAPSPDEETRGQVPSQSGSRSSLSMLAQSWRSRVKSIVCDCQFLALPQLVELLRGSSSVTDDSLDSSEMCADVNPELVEI